jgi:hypothetical protein
LSRIFAFAAPIGPCGSSTPPEQLLSDTRMIGAVDTRQSRGRLCERNAAHDDMESGGCNFVRLCLTEVTLNSVEPQPLSFNLSLIRHVPPATPRSSRGCLEFCRYMSLLRGWYRRFAHLAVLSWGGNRRHHGPAVGTQNVAPPNTAPGFACYRRKHILPRPMRRRG